MNLYLAGTFSRPYVFEQIGGGGMNIYLAGGISGNLQPIWTKIANGGDIMNIYLAGEHPVKNGKLVYGGGATYFGKFLLCPR